MSARVVAAVKTQVKSMLVRLSGGKTLRLVWRKRPRVSQLLACLLGSFFAAHSALALDVNALPSGAAVKVGTGQVQQAGNQMTIVQTSPKLGLDWQNFNIGANASVRFVQPGTSSIALNRILGNSGSEIFGSLSANGQVFLSNPNGILFAPGASVNVGGLVASALDLSHDDFAAGRYQFTGFGGSVFNQGSLTAAPGGYVALLGGNVVNQGSIDVAAGSVYLAAGRAVTLDIGQGGLLSAAVTPATAAALVSNSGNINAAGGSVKLDARAAQGIAESVVNNTGIIRAGTVENRNGEIWLTGAQQINNTGTLDVSAGAQGNGGRIIVKADMDSGTAAIGGNLLATGGNLGGDGGFIETSGAHVKIADSAVISTQATQGATGQWLIDPSDYTVQGTGGDITGAALGSNLNRSNVTILSSQGAAAGSGDVRVNDAVNWTSANTLTLSALRNVDVNANLTGTGGGSVVLRADNTGTGVGTVNFGATNTIALSGTGAKKIDIYYNPSSYTSPTAYTGTLTAHMLVNTVDQLQAMSTNLAGAYALGKDIDASATNSWNSGAGFVPIGSFSNSAFRGIFDGGGHSISNLTINSSDYYVGLFGAANGAKLRNLTFVNERVTASNAAYVGGVVGYMIGGSLDKVSTSGSVTANSTGSNVSLGGVVGQLSRASLSNASNASTVTAANSSTSSSFFFAGGLVGVSDNSTLNQVSNSAAVSAAFSATAATSGASYGPTGGLIGSMNSGSLSKAKNTGAVTQGQNYSSYGTGGLVGQLYSGSLQDSSNTGAVSGYYNVGGLLGSKLGSGALSISNAYNSGSVTGQYYVGGLAGNIYDNPSAQSVTNAASSIQNAYNSGDIHGSTYVGGLVGRFDNARDAAVNTSYNSGTVTGSTSTTGGLLGSVALDGGAGTVLKNSFWDTTTSGQATTAGSGGIGKTTDQLLTQATYSGFDFANTWWMSQDNTRPLLRSEYSTNISNAHQLQLMGMNASTLAASYTLAANVDMSELGRASGAWATATGFVPVGNANTAFGGSLNGMGYSINNLLINRPTADNVGLVGVNTGTLTSLSLSGGRVTGQDQTGALVGRNSGSLSQVTSSASVTGRSNVGGLVGSNDTIGSISNAYSTGAASGNTVVGGLLGSNAGSVSNTYATGAVSGSAKPAAVGGLVAENNGTVIHSYWDPQTSGLTKGIAGGSGAGSTTGATALATDKTLQSASYEGFDFDTVWWQSAGNTRPLLRAEYSNQISNAHQLQLIGMNASTLAGHYTVTADLNLAETTQAAGVWNSNTGFVPLGNASTPFSGTLSGGEHTLTQLFVNRTNTDNVGLFGVNTGLVQDLNLNSSTVRGQDAVGALVGSNLQGSLSNVSASANTVTGRSTVGGLVGSNTGRISDASSDATVAGQQDKVGGLVGSNTGDISMALSGGAVSGRSSVGGLEGIEAGSLANAYSTASVSGADTVGGLVGTNTGVISKTWSSGTVAGSNAVGGLVGRNTGTVSASFWDAASSGQLSSAAGTALDTQQAMTGANYNSATLANGSANPAWDMGNVWWLNEGNTRPFLRTEYSTTISNAHQLQLIGMNDNTLRGSYRLSANLDLSATSQVSGMAASAGFVPIGSSYNYYNTGIYNNPFSGTFDGAGYDISNLTINSSKNAYVGLFGYANGADLRNLNLVNEKVTASNAAYVGGVVGYMDGGSLDKVNTSGSVTANSIISNSINLGGAVGQLSGASLSNASNASTVTLARSSTFNNNFYAGGLVGAANYSTLNQVSNSAAVSATATTNAYSNGNMGGLIGSMTSGSLSKGKNTGAVTQGQTNSSNGTGGLVGQLYNASLQESSNTGAVSGGDSTGGLVGGLSANTDVTLSKVFNSGSVQGKSQVGGLLGLKTGASALSISNAYNSGSVTGKGSVGGLAGEINDYSSVYGNYGFTTLQAVYNSGRVDAGVSGTYVGGLVGGFASARQAAISFAYNTGAVVGASGVGALLGTVSMDTAAINVMTNSYWDTTTSGLTTTAGKGGVGKTTAELMTASTFADWDLANTWRLYEGNTRPLLRAFMTPLSVTSSSADKTYDQKTYTGTPTVSYSVANPVVKGSLTLTGPDSQAVNAGRYAITPGGLWSDQQGYDISFVSGYLTIKPVQLSVTGLTSFDKIYDATTLASVSGTGVLAGTLAGDEVALSNNLVGQFASKNVGTHAVALSNVSLTGAQAANYVVNSVGATATISPKVLSVSAMTALDKVYDGTDTARLSATLALQTPGSGTSSDGQAYQGDRVSLSGTGVFASKNVGANQAVTVSSMDLKGEEAGNYTTGLAAASGITASISAKHIALYGLQAYSKYYDATTTATLYGTAGFSRQVTGGGSQSDGKVYVGDEVSMTGTPTATLAGKNVGTQAVTVSNITLTGAQAGNYVVDQPTGLTAYVNRRPLYVNGLSVADKTYDATTNATLSGTAALQTAVDPGTDRITTTTANGTFSSFSNSPYTGDTVGVTGTGTAYFSSKNASASATNAYVNGLSLTGADASNYYLAGANSLSAIISPKKLAAASVSVENKIYDGTTVASLTGATFASEAVGTGTSTDGKAYAGDVITVSGKGVFASKNVGSQNVTVSSLTLAGAAAGNYVADVTATGTLTGTIKAKSLNVTGLTAIDKIYDTTTAVALSGSAVVAVESVGSGNVTDGKAYLGDEVSINGTASAVLASKDVGTRAVNLSSIALTGAQAGNYVLNMSPISATISAKHISATGLSTQDKTYDATTAATLSGAAIVKTVAVSAGSSSDGMIYSGDVVSLSGSATATASFADKNAGQQKPVNVSGLSLVGADQANYVLDPYTGLQASITPKALTATTISASDKTYDGTTAATLSGGTFAFITAGTGSSTDGKAYTGDAVTGSGTGVFASKNVGTQAVTLSSVALAGTDAANYTASLSTSSNLTATINAKHLSVSGLTALNKTYDATTAATLTGTTTLAKQAVGAGSAKDGVAFMGDEVSTAGTATGVFASKNVGTQNVNVSGITLVGAQAGNYLLDQPTGVQATISAKHLTATGLSAQGKTYDATTVANLSGNATLHSVAVSAGSSGDGMVYSGDSVSLTGTATGAFASKAASTKATAVSVSGLSLGGTDQGNYVLDTYAGLSANIAPKQLTVTALSASDKTYDGTTAATLSGGTFTFITAGTGSSTDGKAYTGDVVTGSGTGVFSSKDVGNQAVTLSSVGLAGADAGNYTASLTTASALTAKINAKHLTVSGLTAVSKIYDATTTAVLAGASTLTTVAVGAGSDSDGKALAGDDVSTAGTAVGSFASKNVGTQAVSVSGITLAGAQMGNYLVDQPTTLSAPITAKHVGATGLSAQGKTYDATLAASLSGTATLNTVAVNAGSTGDGKVFDTDLVTVTGNPTGIFASKNASTQAIGVSVAGLGLGGAQAGNYVLDQPTGLSALITPKAITPSSVSVSDKVYDGTRTATLTGGSFAYENAGAGAATDGLAYSGDVVSVSGTGSFASKNAGLQNVTVSGLTLAGPQAGNYTAALPSSGTYSASITAKQLTVSGLSAQSKIYDATTSATLVGTATINKIAAGAGSSGDGRAYEGDFVGTDTANASAVFNAKNVSMAQGVTVSGVALSGTDSGNYTVQQPTGVTGAIVAKHVTVTGLSAQNKIYDATLAASLSGAATLNTVAVNAGSSSDGKVFDVDAVSVVGTPTGQFVSKNASAQAVAVNVTGLSLGGAQAGNYVVDQATGLSALITPKAITPSSLSVSDKVYDGTRTATLTGGSFVYENAGSGTATDGRAYIGDLVNVSGTGGFTSKNVGTQSVSASNLSLAGAQAGNYTAALPSGIFNATITPAALTISAVPASKTYDGNTTSSQLPSVVNLQTGDTVTALAQSFDSRNAGSRSLSVSGFTVNDGNNGQNYTVTSNATAAGSISKAALTIAAVADSKTYDGNTTSSQRPTVTGLQDADTASALVQSFDSRNAGSRSLGVSGFTVNDGNSGQNYTVTSNATAAGSISKAALTIAAVADSKTYDGNTTSSQRPTVTGLQDADTASALVQSFDGRNAGSRSLGVSGFTVNDGNSGQNYTVTSNATAAGSISKAALALKADDSIRIYGDANPVFSSQLTGFVAGETMTTAGITGAASYATEANARSNVGNYAVTPSVGTLAASNYSVTSFLPGNLSVGQRELLVMGDNVVRFSDEPNPSPFTFSTNVSGLANDDSIASLVVTAPPESLTAKGGYIYPLVASNASFASGLASNYTVNYGDGLLLVLPRPPKVVKDTESVLFIEVDIKEENRTKLELQVQQEVLSRATKPTSDEKIAKLSVANKTGNSIPDVPAFVIQVPAAPADDAKFDLNFVRQMPLLSIDERLTNPPRQP